MARPTWLIFVVGLGTTLLGGCGTVDYTPFRSDALTVSWGIDVTTPEEGGFGARVMVNGEQVYLESGTTLRYHHVQVVRPYLAGENLVQVEIVSSSKSPAAYGVSSSAQVNPNGRTLLTDGFPRTLGVGESLFLRIS